jgi:membrane-associated phospholipid phosphatase
MFSGASLRGVSDRVKRPLAGCLACALGLAIVAALAYRSGGFGHADAAALSRLSSLEGTWLEGIARFFVDLGDPPAQLLLLALVCLVGMRRRIPRRTVAAVVLVAGANLTTQILKAVLAHPRYQSLLGYRQVGETAFPSGHSTAVVAMALAWALVLPRSWRPLVLALGAAVAIAVGLSLVVLHHHFPSDVVGGWLVAAGWGCAVVAALRLDAGRLDGCPSEPA